MLKLYDMELSGNCYKVRLLLSLLDEEYDRIAVDLSTGENMSEEFRNLNPRGEVPVLVDGGTVVWDSHAILAYLTRRRKADTWFPTTPSGIARTAQWLAVAAHEIQYGLAAARACIKFGRSGNLDELQQTGSNALKLLDTQLGDTKWLAGEQITIADLACYPYASCAEDGGILLGSYNNISRWFEQIESLNGYVPMLESVPSTA